MRAPTPGDAYQLLDNAIDSLGEARGPQERGGKQTQLLIKFTFQNQLKLHKGCRTISSQSTFIRRRFRGRLSRLDLHHQHSLGDLYQDIVLSANPTHCLN